MIKTAIPMLMDFSRLRVIIPREDPRSIKTKQENAKAVAYIIVDFLNRPNFLFSFQLEEMAKKVNLLGIVLNNRTFPIPGFVYERV